MYCPDCGTECAEGLRFCTRCGVSLTKELKSEQPKISFGKLAAMFWAIAIFGLVSISALAGIMIPLTIFHAGKEVIVPVMIFGSGAIITIAALLIRQLARLISIVKGEDEASQRPRPVASRRTDPQLAAPPRAFGSVTENTTRTFDPVYRDSETRE
ncbi:MAG TPA: hypothetical protein VNN73_07850 [Blastocatellia bacterium]|nr:hypothetical protein [Blastocatellia bacterium]